VETFGLSGLDRWLAARGRLVLDGALATELERRGADLRDPLWSARLLLERPDLIREVHLDYYRAGADVATTASYQATFEGFARRGLDASAAADLMRLSVRLACEARDAFRAERQRADDPAGADGSPGPWVAASIGPYGAMLADGSEYRGHYGLDESALMDFHRARLHVLADAGADLLAVETIPCLAEARAVARLLRDERPATPAWISFSARDGLHNSQGEPLADCVAALDGFEQVVAIGINCTAPQHIDSLVAAARGRTAKPVLVYPNAGESWDAVAKRWVAAAGHEPVGEGVHGEIRANGQPMSFADQALRWAGAGARIIGGCCRSTPDDIAALSRCWRP
jgi:homocysteine S-methyltransferase